MEDEKVTLCRYSLLTTTFLLTAGKDYMNSPADIVFGPYELRACTTIGITDNGKIETGLRRKSFTVSINSSTFGVSLGERTSAEVIIEDDDGTI